jgi:hypothetical protein
MGILQKCPHAEPVEARHAEHLRNCIGTHHLPHAELVEARRISGHHRLAKIPSKAALGSATLVIGRPITRWSAPSRIASGGVMTRFWSP